MSLSVIICDDSAFARKQLAKALPSGWDINLTFAANGAEAITAIKQGKGDLIFLDLNMPVMDGYQTLEAIKQQNLNSLVLVVSGDVQAEAKRKVMSLGALDFIKKPIDADIVTQILFNYGIINELKPHGSQQIIANPEQMSLKDLTQEVINIAMGQAGKQLGKLLGTFIHLPVPEVHFCNFQDLPKLMIKRHGLSYSAVSQGFVGSGIAGEALAIISSLDLPVLAEILQINAPNQQVTELETLTELTGLLAGACLQGIAEQLDIQFSLGHPTLLGQNSSLPKLLGNNKQQVLAIDLDYQLPDQKIQCDLILVFTQDSIQSLTERMSLLNE